MNLLSSIYDASEIGNFGPQASTSQFWLDDLYGKELYVGDEATANELNIQTYLLLLEGNKALKTEIKNGKKLNLEPKPVLMSSNKLIYTSCQSYGQAIRDRCLMINLTKRDISNLQIRPDDSELIHVLYLLEQIVFQRIKFD